jgi:hypothetical protein
LNTSKVRKKSVKFALEPLGGLDQQGVKIDARKASTPPPPPRNHGSRLVKIHAQPVYHREIFISSSFEKKRNN